MIAGERPHVVVIGGGLAGLSCALSCADGGAQVSLFEARPRLGGATWSFTRNGRSFDNGQHVFLRCCDAYRRFLVRIGSDRHVHLQKRLELPVLRPHPDRGPDVAWIRRGPLAPPFHLARGFLGYRFLTLADRLLLGRAFRALQKARLTDGTLDEESLGSFLRRHGQSTDAIAFLWNLIALPTTNLPADEVSLLMALKVFRTGFIDETDAADLGWSRVPLLALHADPVERALLASGSTVHRRAKVSAIECTETRRASGRTLADAVVVDGERVRADAVVLAVPHTAVAELLPGEASGTVDLSPLGSVPIVDVHLVYDRKVMDYDIAAGVSTPVQFVFDRTEAAGVEPGQGQCLAVSVSSATTEVGERPEALIERYQSAISELFPIARRARVLDAVVSREHAATFRGAPGTAKLRLGSTTAVANLFLAGSWTDTGWPATMEGAVRSGNRAAYHVLSSLGTNSRGVAVPEEVVA